MIERKHRLQGKGGNRVYSGLALCGLTLFLTGCYPEANNKLRPAYGTDSGAAFQQQAGYESLLARGVKGLVEAAHLQPADRPEPKLPEPTRAQQRCNEEVRKTAAQPDGAQAQLRSRGEFTLQFKTADQPLPLGPFEFNYCDTNLSSSFHGEIRNSLGQSPLRDWIEVKDFDPAKNRPRENWIRRRGDGSYEVHFISTPRLTRAEIWQLLTPAQIEAARQKGVDLSPAGAQEYTTSITFSGILTGTAVGGKSRLTGTADFEVSKPTASNIPGELVLLAQLQFDGQGDFAMFGKEPPPVGDAGDGYRPIDEAAPVEPASRPHLPAAPVAVLADQAQNPPAAEATIPHYPVHSVPAAAADRTSNPLHEQRKQLAVNPAAGKSMPHPPSANQEIARSGAAPRQLPAPSTPARRREPSVAKSKLSSQGQELVSLDDPQGAKRELMALNELRDGAKSKIFSKQEAINFCNNLGAFGGQLAITGNMFESGSGETPDEITPSGGMPVDSKIIFCFLPYRSDFIAFVHSMDMDSDAWHPIDYEQSSLKKDLNGSYTCEVVIKRLIPNDKIRSMLPPGISELSRACLKKDSYQNLVILRGKTVLLNNNRLEMSEVSMQTTFPGETAVCPIWGTIPFPAYEGTDIRGSGTLWSRIHPDKLLGRS